MTDLFDTSDGPDRDELASAYLDGEAALDELTLVEADVDLLGRVEVLTSVRDRLAIDSPPAATVDAQVAAALAAFDAQPVAGTPSSPVTDLASRRRPWTQRMPMGAVAAAAVVIALVVGVATLAGRDTDASDMATGDLDAEIRQDSGAGAGTTGGVAADEAVDGFDTAGDAEMLPSTGTVQPRVAFADDQALAEYVRNRLDGRSAAPTAGSDGAPSEPDDGDDSAMRSSDPCDAVRVAAIDPAQVRIVVPVVLAGDDATAVAHTDADGVDQLVVVRDATCEVTLRRPL